MNRKSFKFFIFLGLIFLLFSFSFVFANEEEPRKLEVDYPDITGIELKTVSVGLPAYVKYIFNFGILAIGLILLGAITRGGILYLTSAGNATQLTAAREQISAAFLGIVILLSSYIILTTINPQLVMFHVPTLTRPATCKGLPDDCPPGYECIGGECIRFPCTTDEECKQKVGKDYVCDPEQKICVLEMEDLTLISLEIPLAQMIDKGIWGEDRIRLATSTLEIFEGFLNEEITLSPTKFNRISDLNKYLKTLTDDCRCDALTPLCDKPENLASPVGCAGDPCKDTREEIEKILKINEEKIEKLKEYKDKTGQQLDFFYGEADKFEEANEEIIKCLERGDILTRNEYLARVEYYEEQGWKTKTISSPGYQPLSTAEGRPVAGGLSVILTAYYPGMPPAKMEGGLNDMKGHRLHTLQDYIDGTTSYVSVAVSKHLYNNSTFHYGDIVRIPELEQKYGNKIRFVVVDTGPALDKRYKQGEIVVDIATYSSQNKGRPSIVDRATITKESGGSRGDPLTFYCSYGGTMFDVTKRPVDIIDIPKELEPKELPPELMEFEPLSCPAYIPIGEMIDETMNAVVFSATLDFNELITDIDILSEKIRDMSNLISTCNEQSCVAVCGCFPNPCYGQCVPPPGGCGPQFCQSPCLQSVGVCKGKNPDAPFHGSPCPRDDIEETVRKIKLFEDEILGKFKTLETNFSAKPYVLEVPQGSADLLNGVRAATGICYNENPEEPTWAVLNCGLALGNNGPDNKTIADCHPQSFFCCTADKAAAARARGLLSGVIQGVGPLPGGKIFPPSNYGKNNVPYFAQNDRSWASDLIGTKTISGAGCKLTSLAMVLKYFGVETDPGDLNSRLRGAHLFSGNNMITPSGYLVKNFGIELSTLGTRQGVIKTLEDGKHPIIVGFLGGSRGAPHRVSGSMSGQHWIVLTGIDEDYVYINDPIFSRGIRRVLRETFLNTPIFKYGEAFQKK